MFNFVNKSLVLQQNFSNIKLVYFNLDNKILLTFYT